MASAVSPAAVLAHWRAHCRVSGNQPAPRIAMALACPACLSSPQLSGIIASSIGRAQVTAGSGSDRAASIVRRFDFGWFGAVERIEGTPAALLLFVALVAFVLGLRSISVLGLVVSTDLAVWVVAYVVFVLLVTPLLLTLLQYLLLASPFLVALPLRVSDLLRRVPAALLSLAVIRTLLWPRWFWIRYVYILDPVPALLPFAA